MCCYLLLSLRGVVAGSAVAWWIVVFALLVVSLVLSRRCLLRGVKRHVTSMTGSKKKRYLQSNIDSPAKSFLHYGFRWRKKHFCKKKSLSKMITVQIISKINLHHVKSVTIFGQKINAFVTSVAIVAVIAVAHGQSLFRVQICTRSCVMVCTTSPIFSMRGGIRMSIAYSAVRSGRAPVAWSAPSSPGSVCPGPCRP